MNFELLTINIVAGYLQSLGSSTFNFMVHINLYSTASYARKDIFVLLDL